ncbi:MAG: ribonuclease III [Phycisphaerales bacterium]|nr:MAG: ribonuclease III [Phycisphaerales bacterium]
MTDEQRREIEQVLDHEFRTQSLLDIAFTHASATDTRLESNERLEFLGDAILGAVVCEMIFEKFPDLLEGEMTKIKSAVVSRRVCARIVDDLGLSGHMLLGKGMQERVPASLTAALFEAIIAAIYLDAGYDAAASFIRRCVAPMIESSVRSGHHQNFKSLLQQHAQQKFGDTPVYRVLDEKGPDHAKCFKVSVHVGPDRYESAWGASKKQAEQQAALNALHAMGVIVEDTTGQLVLSAFDFDSDD